MKVKKALSSNELPQIKKAISNNSEFNNGI